MADNAVHLAGVRSYHAEAVEEHVAGIVKHLGIALRSRDASLVSCSDPDELARIREGFLKKKLALTQSDAELDAAIQEVCTAMASDRTKERVTFYYLLAKRFDKLALFD